MKTHRFSLLVFAPVLVLLFGLLITQGSQGCKASPLWPNEPESFTPITSWQIFEDSDFHLRLEIPVSWKAITRIQQTEPYNYPEAIIKRVEFSGEGGEVNLDIWQSRDLSLEDWLKWYGETRNPTPFEINATVAGRPAMSYVDVGRSVDMLRIFLSDGPYIYRIEHSITRHRGGIQATLHMIDSFTSPKTDKNLANIPDKVKKKADDAVSLSAIAGTLSSSCCGYSQSYNPFGCCSNTGNCVWWVYYKFGYVPFRGDAWTWWGEVLDYPEWTRGSSPTTSGSNIAWWNKTTPDGTGHVAYVASYSGGSNISLTEMLWCTSCGRSRTIPYTNAGGYIYYADIIDP